MLALPEHSISTIDAIHHMSAERLLTALASESVDLIVTDPPYMGVKDEAWDNQWATEADYIAWIGSLCQQWRRVLKPNGSLYVFASPRMAARVEVKIGEYFNVLNNVRWMKEAGWHNKTEKEMIRGYLSNWETIVFAEQFASDSRYSDADYLLWGRVVDPLRFKLREKTVGQKDALIAIYAADGRYTSVESIRVNASRQLGWLPTEFELMTVGVYEKVSEIVALGMSYHELRREYEELRREYEELRRPFNLTAYDQYTDVWRFDTVQAYAGKHPCEKPLALMKHIINVSSRAGAVVLDCFAGSGATLDAARQLGRHYIGCEMDAHWANYARRRLSHAYTIPMFTEMLTA